MCVDSIVEQSADSLVESIIELDSNNKICEERDVESNVPREKDVNSVREVCPYSVRENCDKNSVGEQGGVESVFCVEVSKTRVGTDVTAMSNVFDAVVCHMESQHQNDIIGRYRKKTL